MEEMERYGDYNEVDEAPGGNKNPVVTAIKITICSLCVLVIGILAFRLVLFNYYPKEMKNIYYNDTLRDYYKAHEGDIGAKTQSMRAPYDDPDNASFMCDNLIVIEGAGQLQLSVRYNSSIFDTIEEKYGVKLDQNSDNLFSFRLVRVPFDGSEPYEIGSLDYVGYDTAVMYTYYKLVFDGVEFLGEDEKDWIRLEIRLNDLPDADPYYILVYERSEDHYLFSDYKLSEKEKP